MSFGFGFALPAFSTFAAWNNPLGYTLNLNFTEQVYEIFEYGPLDASLNLDFVNQIYQSE